MAGPVSFDLCEPPARLARLQRSNEIGQGAAQLSGLG